MPTIPKILKKRIIFDKNNEPVIIDGIAQRDIKKEEDLFYYGETLTKWNVNIVIGIMLRDGMNRKDVVMFG